MKLRPKITLTYAALVVAGVGLVSLLTTLALEQYVERRTVHAVHQELEVLTTLFGSGNLVVDSAGTSDAELDRLAQIPRGSSLTSDCPPTRAEA